jgi:hypothetical protein
LPMTVDDISMAMKVRRRGMAQCRTSKSQESNWGYVII